MEQTSGVVNSVPASIDAEAQAIVKAPGGPAKIEIAADEVVRPTENESQEAVAVTQEQLQTTAEAAEVEREPEIVEQPTSSSTAEAALAAKSEETKHVVPGDELGFQPEVDDNATSVQASAPNPSITALQQSERAASVPMDMQREASLESVPPLVAKPEPEEVDVDADLYADSETRPDAHPTPSWSAVAEMKPQASQSISSTGISGPGPVSKVAQLTARIERDPLDGEAQLALLADAEQKGDLERTREVYENFLKVFPDSATHWIAYCNLELSHNLFSRVEAIFTRCLRSSTSVALWKFYLDFIRRINPVDPSLGDKAKEARLSITKSFEFALQHIGQDRAAGEIWMEFINFLKEGQNRGTWEDQQRMDSLRASYQRAVCVPLDNVEQIWHDYNLFENNMNKAKKFVAELSPSYMTARKVLRELRAMHNQLDFGGLLPHRPNWPSREDRALLQRWERYLVYEEHNPLDMEDPIALQARVAFAYKKVVVVLRFYSQAWYLAANYYLKTSKLDEARNLLRSGLAVLPSSTLLAYTLASAEEGRGEFAACYTIYDGLVEQIHSRIAALEADTEKEINEAMKSFDDAVENDLQNGNANSDDTQSRQKIVQDKEELKTNIRAKRQAEIDSAKRGAANVWITEMRFARRSEGVKQARSIFTRARKSPYLTWQVVEASALMELNWSSEAKVATNVATNIFELGLKTFAKNPDYVLQYLDFLIRSNNPNNARSLFERTVALIEPTSAKPVWDRMAEYEYQYGDYLSAQKMFQRYSEAFPEISAIERFAQRHNNHGLGDALKQELGEFHEDGSGSQALPSRSVSPSRRMGHGKRELSADTRANSAGPVAFDRKSHGGNVHGGNADWSNSKRLKANNAEVAPALGQPIHWGRRDEVKGLDVDMRGQGRRGPKDSPQMDDARSMNFASSSRGDLLFAIPDGVLFFLSILPGAVSFNGPILNPQTMVDVITTTIFPGAAGGPGERLGIPPRPKPGFYGAERPMVPLSPPRHGARGEPDYGYGSNEIGLVRRNGNSRSRN